MRILLILLSSFLIANHTFAQTPSFKIQNSAPAIPANAKVDSTSDSGMKYYKTYEIALYHYYMKDKEILRKELLLLSDSLNEDSNIDSVELRKFKTQSSRERINNKSNSLKSKINKLESITDSLYHIYVMDYLQHKKSTVFSFGPKRSRAFFDIVYSSSGKRFKLLNDAGFSIGDRTGSIYSELASGNLGLFRVSLGSVIASSSEENSEEAKKNEAYQRLATYGGNTVLGFEYPLAYVHSRNNQYNLIVRSQIKGTADFPQFGTKSEGDKWAGSGLAGIDIFGDASLDRNNNSLRFFTNISFNAISGTDVYRHNLNINNNSFLFGQVIAGLVLSEHIKLSFTIITFSSEESLRNNNVIIMGQVLK